MSEPITGENRIVADRMWRDPDTRADFERETKLTDTSSSDYYAHFRQWAADRLRYGDFHKELTALINKHSMESRSGDTPDFLLADYLLNCLKIFDGVVKRRDAWYSFKSMTEGGVGILADPPVRDSDIVRG
jgi:hypothetical protein